MNIRRRASSVIIFGITLLFLIGTIATRVLMMKEKELSEFNTTEFSATVKSVRIEGDNEHGIIYTEEYGKLSVFKTKENVDINQLLRLKEGQIIYFRINNIWIDQFENAGIVNIVSLRTSEKEILSLHRYNETMKKSLGEIGKMCEIWGVIFFWISLYYGIELYITFVYGKLYLKFCSDNWMELEERAVKQRNLCNVLVKILFNRQIRWIYNSLCLMMASIVFIREDENKFINYLNDIKKEQEFELKAFLLTLYYRSHNNTQKVNEYLCLYQNSNHQNRDIEIIMRYLFVRERSVLNKEDVFRAANNFRNPAIIKLFRENQLLVEL